MKEEPIELDFCEPHPDKPGYVRYTHSKKLRAVEKEIQQRLRKQGLWDEMDYFHVSVLIRDKDEAFPYPYRSIKCYAVTGGSEGYYIHVEAAYRDPKNPYGDCLHKDLFTGKTFSGMETALKISNALTLMLGA